MATCAGRDERLGDRQPQSAGAAGDQNDLFVPENHGEQGSGFGVQDSYYRTKAEIAHAPELDCPSAGVADSRRRNGEHFSRWPIGCLAGELARRLRETPPTAFTAI